MSTRIEIVDPVQFAGIAGQILQTAWKRPCLQKQVVETAAALNLEVIS